MDKLNKMKVVLLLLLSINYSAADDTELPFNIIDAAKLLYSLPTDSDSWMSLQPPNLE